MTRHRPPLPEQVVLSVRLLLLAPFWVLLLVVDTLVGWAIRVRERALSGPQLRRYPDQPGRW